MKKNPLLGALPIIATMLGQKLGVQVVMGAPGAATDGRVIYLPALPPDGDPTLTVLANGFIDHEAAHIRYTDFNSPKPAGLTGLLTNVLEDVRIERLLGERFPGSRQNLAALVDVLEAQSPQAPLPDAPIGAQVAATLAALLRAQLLGQTALASSAATLETRINGLLPQGAVVKLLALAFEVRQARSTAEVIALAQRIVTMLEAEAHHPPDPPDPQGGAGSDTGSDSGSGSSTSQQAASGSGAESDASAHPQRGAGSDTGSDSGSGSSASQQAAAGSGAGSDTGSGSSTDPQGAAGSGAGSDDARRSALAALLTADAAAGDGSDLGAQVGALLEQHAQAIGERAVTMAVEDPPPPHHDPQTTVAGARAATAHLRRRLGGLIQDSQYEATWRTRCGRRLDPSSLYRPAVGQALRFIRQEVREAPNTAVAILLDRSGSMCAHIDLAGQAVLATALALETLPGVACWAAAFPGSQSNRIIPLKAFEERACRVAGRFALCARGATPLAQALWRAGHELVQRPESRRLIVVATDGQPDNPGSAYDIIARCRAGGIEVIGLGIGQSLDTVQAVFGDRDATAIETIDALAPALFAVLERRLTQTA